MAVYKREQSVYGKAGFYLDDNARLIEHHLYGSSRLGLRNEEIQLATGKFRNNGMDALKEYQIGATRSLDIPLFDANRTTRPLGAKQYELSNHLGNVLVTVSDRKLLDDMGDAFPANDRYTADVTYFSDYYPFGMAMMGRRATGNYRYGFNGKENDPSGEWGVQTIQDYGFRLYNPGLARWLSIDPLVAKYPYMSPYASNLNNPIKFIDIDGRVIVNPDSESAKQIKAILDKTETGKIVWQQMVESPNKIHLHVIDFYEMKELGIEQGEEYNMGIVLHGSKSEGVVATGHVLFDAISTGDWETYENTFEGDVGVFDVCTGEYCYEEGVDQHLIIDIEELKYRAKEAGIDIEEKVMEAVVEEAVHTTQLYFDPGVYYHLFIEDGEGEKYVEMSEKERHRVRDNLIKYPELDDKNYESQTHEREAKDIAKKAVKELRKKNE